MSGFERVSYRDGVTGRKHVVTLKDPREAVVFGQESVVGVQVGPDGDDVADNGVTLFVVSVEEVTSRKPLELDLHYARLVPEGTAKVPVTRRSES